MKCNIRNGDLCSHLMSWYFLSTFHSICRTIDTKTDEPKLKYAHPKWVHTIKKDWVDVK